MKYLLVVTIIITALLSFVLPVRSFRLPFTANKPAQTLSFVGVESKACTEKGVKPYGFPFRINLYDECEQDESVNVIAFLANVIFWISIASFAYIRLSKR